MMDVSAVVEPAVLPANVSKHSLETRTTTNLVELVEGEEGGGR